MSFQNPVSDRFYDAEIRIYDLKQLYGFFRFWPKSAKIPLFADFDQTSSKRNICFRNVLKMVGTFFESLQSIFFEKRIFIKFSYFFVPFWNQNGINKNTTNHISSITNYTVLAPKRHKKV